MNYFDELYAELNASPEYVEEHLASTFAGLIRRYMHRHGITQKGLAGSLGVSQADVAKKICGEQNLTLSSLANIAVALGAEWVGIDLISHEEARQREQRIFQFRNMKQNILTSNFPLERHEKAPATQSRAALRRQWELDTKGVPKMKGALGEKTAV